MYLTSISHIKLTYKRIFYYIILYSIFINNIPIIMSNLSYEFYYLLRTSIDPDHPIQSEPDSFAGIAKSSLRHGGLAIDEDKRLFRFDTFFGSDSEVGLPEQWQQQLLYGWRDILQFYQSHFEKQGVVDSESEAFCQQALLGVAVLIADVKLDSFCVSLPFSDNGDDVVFQPRRQLMGVDGKSVSARLFDFNHYHYQLQLDNNWLQLAPFSMDPFAANPVFAVYGLEHGELSADSDSLQDFLLGRGALIVRLLPRLLTCQWQAMRQDLAAREVRRDLRGQSRHFNKVNLPCLSNGNLSEGLQVMATLDAEITLFLGKLRQAVKTIEIQQHNVEHRLRLAKSSSEWKLVWQLDSFSLEQQKLQNHATYIEGELTYLEGIRRRWHLHFEGRQLAGSERVGGLGNILAFLVAVVAASIAVSDTKPSEGSWLTPLVEFFGNLQSYAWVTDLVHLFNNPVFYWLFALVLLSPIFLHWGKSLFRKIHCYRKGI